MESLNLKITKIVGIHSKTCWSQIHFFSPPDEEKLKKWGSLAAVFVLKARKEEIDITSFGKEIIQRFHEAYYSSEKPITGKLKNSFELIKEEFKEAADLQIAAAVFVPGVKPAVYLAGCNSQIKIFRSHKLVILINPEKKIQTVSGWFLPKDIIVLGSNQSFDHIGPKLAVLLSQKKLQQAGEELSGLVASAEENSQMALAVVRLKSKDAKKEELSKVIKPLEKKVGLLSRITAKTRLLLPKIQLPPYQDLGLFLKKREQTGSKNRKTQLTIAIILLVLLFLSVFLGFKKKQQNELQNQTNEILAKAQANYQEALLVADFSVGKSKSLLEQADDILKNYRQSHTNSQSNQELESLSVRISQELEKISQLYSADGELFLELGLVKDGFKGEQWSVVDDQVIILGSDKKTVLKVDLESKQGEIVAGSQETNGSLLVAANPGYEYIFNKNELLMIDDADKKVIDKKETENLGQVNDMVGFSGNVYLLGKDQIYKFVGLDSGLSDKQDFLLQKDPVLSEYFFLAVDGEVWVLSKSGEIGKYVRGRKDFFTVSGWDKPFGEAEGFFTDQNCENLYILDRKNTSIVVIGKDGEYKKSYFWPGIAGALDLAVVEQEGKIFLLTGERIYEMKMR